MKKKTIIIIAVIAVLGIAGTSGNKDDNNTKQSDIISETATPVPTNTPTPKQTKIIEYGELVSINYNGGSDGKTVVIKAKIQPNLTNHLTISQNYENIICFVENNPDLDYNAIDYWAVADMQNGEEGKVISFLVDQNTIEGIKNKTILNINLEEHLQDLWILPSLKE